MPAFEDDFIRFKDGPFAGRMLGTRYWPPPEDITPEDCQAMGSLVLDIEVPEGFPGYHRIRYSEITDEERATMTHVARGAEYEAKT